MKNTGIVRKVDELGRVVLPMELRKTLNIYINCPMEIFTEGTDIILRRKDNNCSNCGDYSEVYEKIWGQNVCPSCYAKFKPLLIKNEQI